MNLPDKSKAHALGRLNRLLADSLFLLLMLALLIGVGWLLARHDRHWDWTSTRDNSLSAETLAILARIEGPLRATVFADPTSPLAKTLERLLAGYHQASPGMQIQFLDPQLFPERARDAEISLVGQILLEYRGRRVTLDEISERAISGAIARLARERPPWIAVVEGHGERAIDTDALTDLGRLGDELSERGFLMRPLDLTEASSVPSDTRMLLMSAPRIPLFPGVAERVIAYLEQGGNLLWLMDPGASGGFEPIADYLGLDILPGTVVDPDAVSLGVAVPTVAVIADFPDHVLTSGLSVAALLPGSLAFGTEVAPGWILDTFLTSGERSWNETGRLEGVIEQNQISGEGAGPLSVVLALTRPIPEQGREQRVLVVGDGDFASNAQIGAYGNRALALALFAWLVEPGDLTALPPEPGQPEALILSNRQRLWTGLGALLLIPGFFLTIASGVRWWRWRTAST